MSINPAQELAEEAIRIIKEAEQKGIILRLMGGLAVKVRCSEYNRLHHNRVPKDIDFVAYSESRGSLMELLPKLGYSTDLGVMRLPAYAEGGRHAYYGKVQIDVYFDRLAMCHNIDWRKRLELDRLTVPLADLVLQKLQIVELSEKDLIDLAALLLQYEVGCSDEGLVNAKYIAKLLANDWGFYYTATTNINKLRNFVKDWDGLSPTEKDKVLQNIKALLGTIENQPKSLKWKVRSIQGTKGTWYNAVEEPRAARKVE